MSYSGTPTLYGEQKIAAAYQAGTRLPVTQIAVGDGAGSAVQPTEGMTALVNEVWRGAITSWGVDPTDTRRIVVHTTIPATAGPFTVREAAIFDSAGGMIAITALAATEIVAPGTSNQATSIDLTIALPIGSAGALTVTPGAGERILIERLWRTPFISINSASVATPPATPAVGDLYIVPANPQGAWATATVGTIAEWNGTFWAFIAPPLKMVAGIEDQVDDGAVEYIKWDGTAWEPFALDGVVFSVVDAAGASTPDELVGMATPGLTALRPNMIFRWRQGAAANVTATPHGNVDGLGDIPFRKADASSLAPGDLPAGADFLSEFDGTQHRVLGQRPSDLQVAGSQTLVGLKIPGSILARYVTPGTFTLPLASGVAFEIEKAQGGGGGGGGANGTSAAASGGGGGGLARGFFATQAATVLQIVVGAGGAAGPGGANPNDGGTGGTTSVSVVAGSVVNQAGTVFTAGQAIIGATGGTGGGAAAGTIQTSRYGLGGYGFGGDLQDTGDQGGLGFGSTVPYTGGFGGAAPNGPPCGPCFGSGGFTSTTAGTGGCGSAANAPGGGGSPGRVTIRHA